MPYIGVRHVLKSAGLLKHQEQISSELGVETISDLIELREADLQQLGLQAHWPKFEAELKATLQSGAVITVCGALEDARTRRAVQAERRGDRVARRALQGHPPHPQGHRRAE